MNTAKFCIQHKVTTLLAVIMIAIFGVVFTTQLQMALLPNMEAPMAVVMCYYNGATPNDIEELVTRPLESAIMAVPGVDSVSSTSSDGVSQVQITYVEDTDLDIAATNWLEDFLLDFEGTVIVVSHDRHFLNTICTHIVDIDYNKIKMYVGNYDFWYESSQMVQAMLRNKNKRNQEKIEELQLFIQRFSANKAKAKQATARRKLLDKLTVEEMPCSTRRYPFVGFQPERELGKDVLTVKDVSVTVDGVKLLDKVYFSVNRGDKIAFVGENELAQTALFKILMGELEPDEGSVKWGVSTIRSYLPKDNSPYFDGNQMELVDWLRQYSAKKDDVYLRGFLGRMLFSNEDVFKPVNVLSGGEKVRCMLSRMMLSGANVVLLDQPTNHLDMESIQAVNKGLEAFPGVVLLASHDHELLTSTCNRVIAFQPDGTIIDKYGTYDDYLAWMAERRQQG